MPIVRKIDVRIEPADLARRIEGNSSGPPNPVLRALTQELMGLVNEQQLIQAAVAFELFPIASFEENRLVLSNGAILEGRLLVTKFKSASRIATAMCTIGPPLEEMSQEFYGQEQELESMLLDGIGNAAIDALGRETCLLIRQTVEEDGHNVSSPLCPGLFGVPMENQAVMHRLVQGEQAGISLTEGMMMTPKKSLSIILGVGADLAVWNNATACSWCNMKSSCAFRISEDESA